MINLKRHTNIALGYFLIVGLLGGFLRLFFVTAIPANYRFIVHAHSHIALLGWVYIALATLIYKIYFAEAGKPAIYRRIFWFTNICILGMLCSFPFQGYALFSIIFSTLFLIASYFLAWFIFKHVPGHFKELPSYKCIKAALWYMVFSSIGPWAIGGVMATLGKTSIWYKLSIYFYLHFQYNGWFILALIGILFFLFERNKISIPEQEFKRFFRLINGGIILSFFLSILWTNPPFVFYILAAAGAVLQVLAFFKFFKILLASWKRLQFKLPPFTGMLLKICGILLVGKVLLQLLTAIPFFADLSFRYTDFVIGYLHWTFLGVISIGLFAFLKYFKLLKLPRPLFWIYFCGFVLSEVLIFHKGFSFWQRLPFLSQYASVLVGISALLPLSVGIVLINNIFSAEKGNFSG